MPKNNKRGGGSFFGKLIFFLSVIAVFLAIGLWYANEYILPVKGKALIMEYLTRATGREVALESVYYNPFRGISIKNLTISDDPKYQRTFLKVKRLYFSVLYLPLFQEKKIIIPFVKIESPEFFLTIDDENKWNFESLIQPQPAAQARQFAVLIYKVSASGGRCVFEDHAMEPLFSKELKDFDLQASVGYPLKVKYRLEFALAAKQKKAAAARFAARGEFDPRKKEGELNLQLKEVPLEDFQPYYAGLAFKYLAGDLSGEADVSYSQQKPFAVSATYAVKETELQGEEFSAKGAIDGKGKLSFDPQNPASIKYEAAALVKEAAVAFKPKGAQPFSALAGNLNGNVEVAYAANLLTVGASSRLTNLNLTGDKFSAKGEADLNGKLSLNPSDKTTLKYNAEALLKSASARGVPSLDAVEKINGKVFFTEAKSWADAVKGVSHGMELVLAGSVKDYANPYLALTIKTRLNLAKLNEFADAALKERLKDNELSGTAQTTLNVSGPLKDKAPLGYAFSSQLSDCGLKSKLLPKPLSAISGTVTAKADSLNLKDVTAAYDGKTYRLSGDVTDFKTPHFNMALATEGVELKADFVLQDSLATFSNLEGKYKNIKFNLFGAVSDFDNPLLDFYGSAATDVNELKNYLPPKTVELLNKNEVGGNLTAKFYFKGRWKDDKTWRVEFKAESPQLQVRKFKFNDFYVDYRFKDNIISIPALAAKPYGGTLLAKIAIDCTQDNPQYAAEVSVRDVDISKWKGDTEFKDKDIKGLFYAAAQFGGFGKNIETLRGNGQFAIIDGKLWELPVFAGLAGILFVPGIDKIVFREAGGSFTVGNKVVYTGDTQMRAVEMSLVFDGNLDFDGNLAFSITAVLARELLAMPSQFGALRDLLIDDAGNFIADIKLKGSLKEPRYTLVPFPVDKIFRTRLIDRLKGFFENNP